MDYLESTINSTLQGESFFEIILYVCVFVVLLWRSSIMNCVSVDGYFLMKGSRQEYRDTCGMGSSTPQEGRRTDEEYYGQPELMLNKALKDDSHKR
jgi:hypothetical protein